MTARSSSTSWSRRDSMVWPMVPSGVSNDQIQIARGMTPEWEEED